MAILVALLVGAFTIWLMRVAENPDSSRFRPRRQSQAAWAAQRLPKDSYRVEGSDRVILTKSFHVDGLFCKEGTPVVFGDHGRIKQATLAIDCTVDELPLRGGTTVMFDTSDGELTACTLREPTLIGRVPCAPGRVFVRVGRHRRQVTSAILSRDCVLRGTVERCRLTSRRIHCRGGTRIHQRPGALQAYVERFTPRTELWCWGFRCAAEQPIDTVQMSGTLADDHVYDHITLPAGSTFAHEWDEDEHIFGRELLWVKLSRSTRFRGHRLPAEATIWPDRDMVKPAGRFRRWQKKWGFIEEPALLVYRNQPWTLGGVRIPALTSVYILADGGFRYFTDRDVVHDGVLYPEGSQLEHAEDGRIRRWTAGPDYRRPDHPYRAPAAG